MPENLKKQILPIIVKKKTQKLTFYTVDNSKNRLASLPIEQHQVTKEVVRRVRKLQETGPGLPLTRTIN